MQGSTYYTGDYRLISRGKWSAGYVDEYVIEKLGKDNFGDARWDLWHRWCGQDSTVCKNTTDEHACNVLASGIRAALTQHRDPIVEKIVAYLRTFGDDASAMIDGILEGRPWAT